MAALETLMLGLGFTKMVPVAGALGQFRFDVKITV